VWWLPPEIDLAAFRARAAERGLHFQAISDFCKRVVLPAGLVIGYAALEDEALVRHTDELCRLIRAVA
jgi:GntR family transcriptional regulator/MocR family aminotransferase